MRQVACCSSPWSAWCSNGWGEKCCAPSILKMFMVAVLQLAASGRQVGRVWIGGCVCCAPRSEVGW